MMKVKELIEQLQKYDGDMNVFIYDYDDCVEYDNIFMTKEIESFMMGEDGKPIGSRIDVNLENAEKQTRLWNKVKRRDVLVLFHEI